MTDEIDLGEKPEAYDAVAFAGWCIELHVLPKAMLVRAEQDLFACSHLVSDFSWAVTTLFTAQVENIIVPVY